MMPRFRADDESSAGFSRTKRIIPPVLRNRIRDSFGIRAALGMNRANVPGCFFFQGQDIFGQYLNVGRT